MLFRSFFLYSGPFLLEILSPSFVEMTHFGKARLETSSLIYKAKIYAMGFIEIQGHVESTLFSETIKWKMISKKLLQSEILMV